MRSLCLAILLSAAAVGCAQPAPPPVPQVDLEAERASLLAADQAWYEAYSTSEDPAEVFAMNTVDGAHLMPPGSPMVRGREAIKETIAGLEAMEGFTVSWKPTAVSVSENGDLGYTLGAYEMTVPSEVGPALVVGKYLTVWEKQDDGSWMVTADMFNADGPPEPKP